MLELTLGAANESVIVTLNELQTLDEPNWLFRFTHILTGQVVSFVKLASEDESDYPSRFNKFVINTLVVFANKPPGEWHYNIYEQASTVNTDPALATGLVEAGKMYLLPAISFAYEEYDEPTTFKSYQG